MSDIVEVVVHQGHVKHDTQGHIPFARLLGRTVLILFGLAVFAGIAGLFFRDPLTAVAHAFVARWGGWGILIGFMIPDATGLPIPHDVFLALGLLGGLPIPQIIAFASVGSLTGGTLAFLASRYARKLPFFERRLASRAPEIEAMVARYGVTALAVGALTPLPFSLVCWASGLLGLRLRTFLLVSLLRIPRVAGYLALLHLGFISTGHGAAA